MGALVDLGPVTKMLPKKKKVIKERKLQIMINASKI